MTANLYGKFPLRPFLWVLPTHITNTQQGKGKECERWKIEHQMSCSKLREKSWEG